MATYGIGATARITGLSAFTLRAWESRYGAVKPLRDASGRRLFTESDVVRLQLLAQVRQLGHPISTIAKLPDLELQQLMSTPCDKDVGKGVGRLKREILSAVENYDLRSLHERLGFTITYLSPIDAVTLVLTPVLHDIGDRWLTGELSVAQEHLMSASIQQIVLAAIQMQSQEVGATPLIIGTLSGEQHSLGSLLVSYVASSFGFRVYFVGADLPPTEFARIVRASKATIVGISVVYDRNARRLPSQIRVMYEELEDDVHTVIGGRASRLLRIDTLPPHCYIFESLDAFVRFLRVVK